MPMLIIEIHTFDDADTDKLVRRVEHDSDVLSVTRLDV